MALSGKEEMDWDDKSPQVACMFNAVDLQRECDRQNVRMGSETNRYLLFHTLMKMGPVTAQKIIMKLVNQGALEWTQDEGFEVEAILDHYTDKDEGDKLFYLIKWENWSHDSNTWEPKEHLECEELLAEYHKQIEKGVSKEELRRRATQYENTYESKCRKINDLLDGLTKPGVPLMMSPLTLLELSAIESSLATRLNNLTKNQVKAPKLKNLTGNISNKRSRAYRDLKKAVQAALKEWERQLNAINTDPAPISVINDIDLDGPPDKFTYINDYKEGEGITIPQDPIVGCECTDCLDEKKTCCAANAGSEFAYYKHKRARVRAGTPIYECNKRCKCGADCPNRVVQHGRKHHVAIFRTHNGRGWGVKAMQKIKKGSFVMEYVGEVITNEEAERRGKKYDAEGRTYLFDLDYNDGDCPFTVDAGFYGNVSHFVNHSCDPNLAVYGVWINTLDPRLPRIALFAQRDVHKGEELTFDYMMTGDTTHQLQTEADMTVASTGDACMSSPHPGLPTPENSYTNSPAPSTNGDEEEPMDGKPNVVPSVDSTELLPPSEPIVTPLQNSEETPMETSQSDVEPTQLPMETTLVPQTPPGKSQPQFTSLGTPTGTDIGESGSETPENSKSSIMPAPSSAIKSARSPFSMRTVTSPSPAVKYRIMCQCGASNCRKYLF